MRFYRIFVLLTFLFCSYSFLASSKTDLTELTSHEDVNFLTDSLNEIKYKRHVTSLFYIARKTDNSKYFLNLANSYLDSIFQINSNDEFANEFKTKISLILSTCEENLNHKYSFFPFFKKIPEYFGFVDDPLEYAYDKSIDKLLTARPVAFVLEEGNITKSILIRENCNDEIFEIVNQTLIKNVNHSILPYYQLESYLGKNDANSLVNGDLNEESLSKLCEKLNIDRLGVFKVNDIDVIDNSIFLVSSGFCTYADNEGFSDTLSKKAYTVDKRAINFLDFLLHILLVIFIISLFSFVDQTKKLMKIYNDNSTATLKNFIILFINKLGFVLNCFIIPFVFSFVMIYAISSLIPNAENHFLEFSSILWLFSLTIVMSVIPTLLNLLYVNRLDLDGFHSIQGYRYFFNTSLFASYFPLSVFYTIRFETIPLLEYLFLILITLVIADLLARSYYQFTTKSIHKNLKTQSLFGLILGILSLLICNVLILSDLTIHNLFYAFIFSVPISLFHKFFGIRLDHINSKKLIESEDTSLIKDVFINNVLDPVEMIYNKITSNDPLVGMSNDKLNITLLSAPMGIGKTSVLKEAEEIFKDNGWYWCYGDCDEIQGENSVSFEPFLEAFSDLLNIKEFSSRHDIIESQKGVISSAISLTGVNSDFITDYKRGDQKPMTEICVDIIDRLEALDKKTVFVLEDLHWIDPESYEFLKHFIDIVNNNDFLRGNMCIILTFREGVETNFRGIDINTFKEDFNLISSKNEVDLLVSELLNKSDFKLYDFVKHLSDQNNKFKIQSSSMHEINNIFNIKLRDNNNIDVLTPLYILKVLECWIDDKTLKYSPDGYFLTKKISIDNLPNTSEIDGYFHSIFELFEPKWQRLLESAAIIGKKFDAEILAKVWGYELLDILAFLEKAVKYELLVDLSKEDNFYEFKDKRIISAIKSFFSLNTDNNTDDVNDKQIVIEYNKRYVATQNDVILNPNLYSVEDLLKVARRLSTLKSGNKYESQLYDLIREITIRFIISKDFDKIQAFSKYLLSKNIKNISFILNVLVIVAKDDVDSNIQTIEIQKIYVSNLKSKKEKKLLQIFPNNDFEKELIFLCLIYFEENNTGVSLRKNDVKFLQKIVNSKYKEKVLFHISLLLIDLTSKTRKGKFKSYDDLLNNLIDSDDYEFFNNYILIEKITTKIDFVRYKENNTWSDKYPEPKLIEIEPELKKIHKKLLLFNNFKLVDDFLYHYIFFLSQELGEYKKAVELHLATSYIYQHNDIPLRDQVIRKMDMLNLRCSDTYFDLHPDIVAKDFDFVISYVEKRFNKNTYNHFMYIVYKYKRSYLSLTKNFVDLQAMILLQMELMKLKGKTNVYGYAHVHTHYAEALLAGGEEKASLEWFEKKISIQKELLLAEGRSERDPSLRISHFNLAYYYTKYEPKNYEKIIFHAQESFELSNPESSRNYLDTYGYAKALRHVEKFEDSYLYFNKCIELVTSNEFIGNDERSEFISDYKLDAALVYSKIDLDKSIPMIKDALNNAYNPDLLIPNQVELANKILKDNNA